MANAQLTATLRHLRALTAAHHHAERTDRELLHDFLERRDQSAFAALVNRHGPLVLGVCRRELGSREDAEDAFQATFLLLARKAASIRKGDSLPSWLHGVAYRMARNVKRAAVRRRKHEEKAGPAAAPATPEHDAAWQEVQGVLSEEIERLPPAGRAPFILCFLEGRSRAEAAAELGLTPKTLEHRLAAARDLLRQRLARRGVSLSALLAAAAVESAARASAVPVALLAATVGAADVLTQGGTVPAQILSLVNGVAKKMYRNKLVPFVVCLLSGALALGGGLLHCWGVPGAQLAAAPAPAEPPKTAEPLPRTLAFVTCRHGCPEIFVSDADGKETRRVTVTGDDSAYRMPTADGSFEPAWSSDGKRIAFCRRTGGAIERLLYVMDADGKNVKRLTDKNVDGRDAAGDERPVWSPDGNKIMFTSQRDGETGIYVVDADGKNLRRLTENNRLSQTEPAWSPDGKKIAFRRQQFSKDDICVMNADGSDVKNLTAARDFVYNGHPAWSPDGRRILFCSSRDYVPVPGGTNTSNCYLYVMDADGGNVTKLTKVSTAADQLLPAWSPDGKRIACGQGGAAVEIHVINADGSGAKRLTELGGTNEKVLWSPDGLKLAFQHQERDKEGFAIYVMDADGSHLKKIHDRQVKQPGIANAVDMAWKPR
jgi:RNA polymerase sigma factor (sigma-70 family)